MESIPTQPVIKSIWLGFYQAHFHDFESYLLMTSVGLLPIQLNYIWAIMENELLTWNSDQDKLLAE